jgi:hypothetical protein
LRCSRPGPGHREELWAGREVRRKPSGPAASSIVDDVAAEVGGGAAVASIALLTLRVEYLAHLHVEKLGALMLCLVIFGLGNYTTSNVR